MALITELRQNRKMFLPFLGDGAAFPLEAPRSESWTALPFSLKLWGSVPSKNKTKAQEEEVHQFLQALVSHAGREGRISALTVWFRGVLWAWPVWL